MIEEVVGGSVERTYTFGNSLLVNQTQHLNSQLVPSFYGADAHGSVGLLTDGAGEVTNTYAYDAFGNLVSASGSTPNDYLYSGERFDSDLGAYHLRERYYSPQRGRFLTRDPFAGLINVPRTLHKYLYVGADPVNYIDPNGLTETTEYHLNTVKPDVKFKIPCLLYHYTSANPAKILATGLRPGVSGKVFTTLAGDLSPLQALIDLALPPNRGLPVHLIEIDVSTLRKLGITIPRAQKVARLFNLPGGATEVVFPHALPPEALKCIR